MLYDEATDSYYVDPALVEKQQQLLMQAAVPTKLQQKQSKLQAKLTEKQANIGTAGMQRDVLLGMNDADSLILRNANGNTRSGMAQNAFDYDATEIAHRKPDGTYTDPLAYVQSDGYKANQIQHAAAILNKNPMDITSQDLIDIGNWQQVQKLADEAMLPGDKRWQAPLIRNAEQTNLTGHYTDENGNYEYDPLNINIMSKKVGEAAGSDRGLYQTGNLAGYNVTQMHRDDPLMNASSNIQADTSKAFNDYYDSNTAGDPLYVPKQIGGALASGVLNTASSISSAPAKLYEILGGDYLEENSAFAKENPNYAKAVKGIIDWTQKGADMIDAFDKEYVYSDRSNQQAFMNQLGDSFDEGNYVTGLFGAIADQPLGAIEVAVQSYFPSKILTSKGMTKLPGVLSELVDTTDEAHKIFIDTYKREPDANELGLMTLLSAVSTAIDTAAAGYVFKTGGGELVSKGLSDLLDTAVAKLPGPVLAKILGAGAAKKLVDMGVEGFQEGTQEYLKQLGGYQDLDKTNTTDNMKEVYKNAAAGFISPVGMQATDVAIESGKKAAKAVTSKDARKKAKEVFYGTDAVEAEEIAKNNPDLDKSELEKAVKGVKEAAGASLATPADDDLSETQVTPREAPKVDIEKAVLEAQKKVADIKDEGVTESEVLQDYSKEFDGILNEYLLDTKHVSNEVLKDEVRKNPAFVEEDYISQMNQVASDRVETLTDIMEDARKHGAGPNKLAAMQAKIDTLVALTNTKSPEEIKEFINVAEFNTPSKVQAVLGSSAATIEDIDAVLGSEDLTEGERTALEVKKEALTNVQNISADKLFGKGSKPGVFTWISRVLDGKTDANTLNHIQDFIDGQTTKLQLFENAVNKWDRENNMPWTDEADPKYEAYNTPGTKEYIELNKPNGLNNKFSIRNAIMSSRDQHSKLKEPIRVEYGNTVSNRDIAQTANLLDSIKQEHAEMMKLQQVVDNAAKNDSKAKPEKARKTEEPEAEEPEAAPEGKPDKDNIISQLIAVKKSIVEEAAGKGTPLYKKGLALVKQLKAMGMSNADIAKATKVEGALNEDNSKNKGPVKESIDNEVKKPSSVDKPSSKSSVESKQEPIKESIKDTRSESQKGTSKPQTKAEGKSTSEKVEKPSASSEEILQESKATNKAYEPIPQLSTEDIIETDIEDYKQALIEFGVPSADINKATAKASSQKDILNIVESMYTKALGESPVLPSGNTNKEEFDKLISELPIALQNEINKCSI